jgi:hypothetical protein
MVVNKARIGVTASQQIELEFSEQELRDIAAQAKKRGFSSSKRYAQALLEQDAAEDVPLVDDEDDDDDYIREAIKQRLREAIRGETVPLESLWTDDDDE